MRESVASGCNAFYPGSSVSKRNTVSQITAMPSGGGSSPLGAAHEAGEDNGSSTTAQTPSCMTPEMAKELIELLPEPAEGEAVAASRAAAADALKQAPEHVLAAIRQVRGGRRCGARGDAWHIECAAACSRLLPLMAGRVCGVCCSWLQPRCTPIEGDPAGIWPRHPHPSLRAPDPGPPPPAIHRHNLRRCPSRRTRPWGCASCWPRCRRRRPRSSTRGRRRMRRRGWRPALLRCARA